MKNITTKTLPEYRIFLEQAASQIKESRVRAVRMVNKEVVSLYWWLGKHIVRHQDQYGWGRSVVERLSKDLKQAFPSAKFGFSPQNLWYMRQSLRAMDSGTRGRVDPGSLALLISKRRAEGARAKSVKQLLPKA